MALKRRSNNASLVHGLRWLVMLLSCYVSYGTETDIWCLRRIKYSLHDQYNYTANWDFNNKTEGSICRFTGIDCWHPDESRVLNVKLPDMSLKGPFPLGLENCTSLTGLDLSGNKFNGTLPENISEVIGFVTNLDLSNNDFSGEIPENLANCSFLNDLNLANNQFTGQIPLQLAGLARLKSFNVANNNLSGQVPSFNASSITVTPENYAHNYALCGGPLDKCVAPPGKSDLPYTVGGAAGVLTLVIVLTAVAFLYISRMKVIKKKKQDDPEGNRRAKSMKGTKAFKCMKLRSGKVIGEELEEEEFKILQEEIFNLVISSGEIVLNSFDMANRSLKELAEPLCIVFPEVPTPFKLHSGFIQLYLFFVDYLVRTPTVT